MFCFRTSLSAGVGIRCIFPNMSMVTPHRQVHLLGIQRVWCVSSSLSTQDARVARSIALSLCYSSPVHATIISALQKMYSCRRIFPMSELYSTNVLCCNKHVARPLQGCQVATEVPAARVTPAMMEDVHLDTPDGSITSMQSFSRTFVPAGIF